MNRARAFLYIATWPRHPGVFQITPATLQSVGEYSATMPVPSEHSSLFHPQHVGKHAHPDVKCKVANEHVFSKRYPRRFLLALTNMKVRNSIFVHNCVKRSFRVNRRHRGPPRSTC